MHLSAFLSGPVRRLQGNVWGLLGGSQCGARAGLGVPPIEAGEGGLLGGVFLVLLAPLVPTQNGPQNRAHFKTRLTRIKTVKKQKKQW